MTSLWIAMGLLAVSVGAVLARPLFGSGRDAASRAEFDLNIFRDQLDEIERDIERGLLDETAGTAARIEIQRRILAADAEAQSEAGDPASSQSGSTSGRKQLMPLVLAIGVPMAALMFYLNQGSPEAPNTPYAARDIAQQSASATAGSGASDPQASDAQAEMESLIARLVDRLKKTPDDVTGWLLLGRSLATMQRYEEAKNALGRARQLAPGQAEVEITYAEAIILAAKMTITDEAATILQAVHDRAPFEPKSRYYLGLRKAQNDDIAGALQDWVDLLAISPRDAPWRPLVRNQMNRAANDLNVDPASLKASAAARMLMDKYAAGPAGSTPTIVPPSGTAPAAGPTAGQVEAASQMSEEDRNAMILGMVQRLADRLKESPDDLAGWQRLERAYRVLGDKTKADAAMVQIRRLSQ